MNHCKLDIYKIFFQLKLLYRFFFKSLTLIISLSNLIAIKTKTIKVTYWFTIVTYFEYRNIHLFCYVGIFFFMFVDADISPFSPKPSPWSLHPGTGPKQYIRHDYRKSKRLGAAKEDQKIQTWPWRWSYKLEGNRKWVFDEKLKMFNLLWIKVLYNNCYCNT